MEEQTEERMTEVLTGTDPVLTGPVLGGDTNKAAAATTTAAVTAALLDEVHGPEPVIPVVPDVPINRCNIKDIKRKQIKRKQQKRSRHANRKH